MPGLFAGLFRPGRSPADDMIRWLADKSLDDRRIVAGHLYGGSESNRIYAWIASQPDCDRGTASMILWNMLGPARFALARADGSAPESHWGYSTMSTIVARWRRDEFRPAVFAWNTRDDVRVYKRLLKKHFHGSDPLQIPESLMAPVVGRAPVGTSAVVVGDGTQIDRLLQELRIAYRDEWNAAQMNGPGRPLQ